jgi:predicted small secreted protein
MIHIHKYRILPLILLCMGLLSSCETVDGAGRDIEHAGQAVQDSAD